MQSNHQYGLKSFDEIKAEFNQMDSNDKQNDSILTQLKVQQKLLINLYSILLEKITPATFKKIEMKIIDVMEKYAELKKAIESNPMYINDVVSFCNSIDDLQHEVYDLIRQNGSLTAQKLAEINCDEVKIDDKSICIAVDKKWCKSELATNYSKWCCCFTGTAVSKNISDSFISEWLKDFPEYANDDELNDRLVKLLTPSEIELQNRLDNLRK